MKIAVLGYGTVGSGVVEVLDVNQKLIATRAKEEIEVKYVLDLRDFPGDKIQEKIVHDYEIILNDPEIGIVVEVMGGVEPANTSGSRQKDEDCSIGLWYRRFWCGRGSGCKSEADRDTGKRRN